VALLWIVDIYGFMVAGALITMGTLGDRIGRRLLLLRRGLSVRGPECHGCVPAT
jgi:MFS family permease